MTDSFLVNVYVNVKLNPYNDTYLSSHPASGPENKGGARLDAAFHQIN
jgi:hypothetical protein